MRAYIEELLPDVLEGRIEPGRVFDRVIGIDGVPDGYRAMDEREVDQGHGEAVSDWTAEVARIAAADDLHIAPFREDGLTSGTPTWFWPVTVDGALYVRGYNGTRSPDPVAACGQLRRDHASRSAHVAEGFGPMRAGTKRRCASGRARSPRPAPPGPVAFEPVEGAINDRIDGAYRAKYGSSRYLAHRHTGPGRDGALRSRSLTMSVASVISHDHVEADGSHLAMWLRRWDPPTADFT